MSQVETWRRRPDVVSVEECYALTPGGLTRGLRFIIGGPRQEEDHGRLMRGEVCSNCLTPFPAPPRIDTVQKFRDANFRYPMPEKDAESLIARGFCPVCSHEVSSAYAAAMHEGVLLNRPED